MLAGKTVLLCVSGSIAAYKIAYLASALKKLKADVHVLMTRNATNFINPITFETLTGNKCLVDTFDRNFEFSVEHVSLAKAADVVLVAPASANVIAKLAHGLADDMLTTTVLACTCKKIISPAMKAAIDPTERSSPPAVITKVMPTAMMPKKALSVSMLQITRVEANPGNWVRQ